MKSVNLIPSDSRRSGVAPSIGRLGAGHAVLGVLLMALAYVTVYVLTSNTIAQRNSELANLRTQISQVQSQVSRLQTYAQFEKLAQQRAATVRQIAATRFDWHAALSDLSKVVPANTSLQSLTATAAPSAAGASSSTAVGSSTGPSFQLRGCTASQDDVARLMSQLRLINGVTRVTLESSAKGGGSSGTTVAPSPASGSGGGCSPQGPSFDMVVAFQPVAAAPTGASGGQSASLTTGTGK